MRSCIQNNKHVGVIAVAEVVFHASEVLDFTFRIAQAQLDPEYATAGESN